MPESEIMTIASAVARQSFLMDWHFYVVIFCFSLVGGFLGAYVRGYASEKARLTAIDSSLQSIKRNVAETTRAAEEIKKDIEDESWRRKDREALKREKLEAYIIAISEAKAAVYDQTKASLFDADHAYDAHAWNRADMLQALYLPELAVEHNEFRQVLSVFGFWLAEGMAQLTA